MVLTDRQARVELSPDDIDLASGRARLSYRQAEDLFKAASGGATLHQLRYSTLAHDAEDSASTAMLMAKPWSHERGQPRTVRQGRLPRPFSAGRSATTQRRDGKRGEIYFTV